jgi:hypothetical protein
MKGCGWLVLWFLIGLAAAGFLVNQESGSSGVLLAEVNNDVR